MPAFLKPTCPCDDISALAPTYGGEALSLQGVPSLENCPNGPCQGTEYILLMTRFYERIEPVSPPAYLHQRLMNKIRQRTRVKEDPDNMR